VTMAADVVSSQTFTYAWTITERPAGSSAALSNPTSATPVFTPDVVGTYTVQLAVTDSTGGVIQLAIDVNALIR